MHASPSVPTAEACILWLILSPIALSPCLVHTSLVLIACSGLCRGWKLQTRGHFWVYPCLSTRNWRGGSQLLLARSVDNHEVQHILGTCQRDVKQFWKVASSYLLQQLFHSPD